MACFIPIGTDCHSKLERDGKFDNIIHFSLDKSSHLVKLTFRDLDVELIVNLK